MNEAFQQFYQSQWGSRWPDLLKALQAPTASVAHVNPWARPGEGRTDRFQGPAILQEPFQIHLLPQKINPERTPGGLMDFYPIDLASIYPVLALKLTGEEEILDLCAAPGGKSLLILEQLKGGKVILNENSRDRRHRLKRVLEDYVPESVRAKCLLKGWIR